MAPAPDLCKLCKLDLVHNPIPGLRVLAWWQVGIMRRSRYVKGKKVGKGPLVEAVRPSPLLLTRIQAYHGL